MPYRTPIGRSTLELKDNHETRLKVKLGRNMRKILITVGYEGKTYTLVFPCASRNNLSSMEHNWRLEMSLERIKRY